MSIQPDGETPPAVQDATVTLADYFDAKPGKPTATLLQAVTVDGAPISVWITAASSCPVQMLRHRVKVHNTADPTCPQCRESERWTREVFGA